MTRMFEYAKEVKEAYAALKTALDQEEAAKAHLKYARKRVMKKHEALADAIAKCTVDAPPGAYVHDLELP